MPEFNDRRPKPSPKKGQKGKAPMVIGRGKEPTRTEWIP